MALRVFGNPKNEEGEWIPFGIKASFDLKIRRIPDAVSDRINRAHGKEVIIDDRERGQRPTIRRTIDENKAWVYDLALYSLTDSRGLVIEVGDEELAKELSRIVSAEIAVGDTFTFDGRLGDDEVGTKLKRLFFKTVRPFAETLREDPETPGGVRSQSEEAVTFVFIEALEATGRWGRDREAAKKG